MGRCDVRESHYVLGFVLLLLSSSAVALADNSEFKQLGGPPEEIAAMSPANPASSATRSRSATLLVSLTKGEGDQWDWNGVVPVEHGALRFAVLSGGPPWTVTMRDPVTRELKLIEAARTHTTVGLAEKATAAVTYDLQDLATGSVELHLTSNQPGHGVVLIQGQSSLQLVSHQVQFNQQAGQSIALVAHLNDTAPDVQVDARAYVITPDGETQTLSIADDGSHEDRGAADGVYGTAFHADRPGNYRVQIVLTGSDREGNRFLRTVEHLIPVVDDSVAISADSAETSFITDRRLQIRLKANVARGSGRVRAYAEVWGRRNGSPVPVGWIGGMSVITGGELTLGLDKRWILRAGAEGPFELRNLRVEESSNFITIASVKRIALPAIDVSSLAPASEISVDEEMLMGPRPRTLRAESRGGDVSSQEYTDGVGHKLLLVHGYCSSNVWGGVSGQFSNAAVFTDLNANRTLDSFASLIKSFGIGWNSYAIVAHSQGGLASLHLYAHYWSGLDNAGPGRLIQSVGSPYQGTNIAGNWAAFGQVFGAGCGENTSLTYAGAATWLAGVSSSHRSRVNYFTTSFVDDAGYDYCSLATDLLLTDPDDGVVEYAWAQLPGGVNQGHKYGWCHSANMREPAQTTDSARNSSMSSNAAVGPPTVTTNAASSIGSGTATLNGSVNPNGAQATTWFEYGTSTSYTWSISAQTRSGTTSQSISSAPSLICATTYQFRAVANNSAGTRYGTNRSFTTAACPTIPPTVTTSAATGIGQTSATLNGTVNPNGASTTTAFEYGTTTSYGITVSAQTRTGSTSQSISASPSLSCGTTYYYRARGTNSAGTNYGSSSSFTTSTCPAQAPSVNTNGATSITQSSATLNGTVNPNGATASTAFDYGSSPSYGSSANAQTRSGSSSQSISASVSGLQCATTYYFRARASNSGGTTYGSQLSFQTSSCPANPCSYSLTPASAPGGANGGNSSVQVNGSPSGCAGSWSVSSDAGWLTLTGTQSGNGSGSWPVSYAYDSNGGSARDGHLSFSGAFSGTSVFTLSQASATASCTPLALGSPVLLPASSAPRFEFASYCIQVPAATNLLTVEMSGGDGDPDLYVRYGTAPTANEYDCRPYVGGTAEVCTFTNPQSGTWYVGIDTYSPYSNVTLKATTITNEPQVGRNFYLVTPCRVIDTRSANGPGGGPAVSAGGTRTVPLSGTCGIPPSAAAVSLNVTAVTPPATGYLALYATGTILQGTSTVHYRSGRTRASCAIIPLSAAGELNVYNSTSLGPTHFIIDVTGYFY
jgi:pre-peptidase